MMNTTHTQRRLYYFPILHSRADLGGFEDRVSARAIEKMGRQKWEAQCRSIEQGWSGIEPVIDSLDIDYGRCRIYQDGLPICGKELRIVTDLAEAGSRNYELLMSLHGKGATLMGTESLELLLDEYLLIKNYLDQEKSTDMQEMERKGADLLHRRDTFIAERINTTLKSGESGLLFLGLLHSLAGDLSPDIAVIYPIVSPLS
jgi:hypothetical protein